MPIRLCYLQRANPYRCIAHARGRERLETHIGSCFNLMLKKLKFLTSSIFQMNGHITFFLNVRISYSLLPNALTQIYILNVFYELCCLKHLVIYEQIQCQRFCRKEKWRKNRMAPSAPTQRQDFIWDDMRENQRKKKDELSL